MQIPFLDLKKVNAPYEKDFKLQFESFLNSGYYILGNAVSLFEKEFATYCGVKHCIGTGNGLDALTLIFKGYIELGILSKGDEVLVAANTYIATIIAVQNAGLIPVLIDADQDTHNLDIKQLPSKPSTKIKALMVTHLYGQLADMTRLRVYCDTHDLLLLADAAQAHGAESITNKKAGSLADAAGFSFYPTKNLGALGDGGCVTTNNQRLYELIHKLRNYGKSSSVANEYIGINSRLDEIQAGFLSIKLKKLDQENSRRKEIAKRYINEIKNSKISLPIVSNFSAHVFHQFVVKVENRNDFITYLNKNGIGNAIHYPIPPHKQKAYEGYFKGSFPVTEKLANQIVSIPMNSCLKEEEIDFIIATINKF